MKKFVILVAVLLMGVSCIAAKDAFAGPSFFVKMVTGNGSTTEQPGDPISIYEWSQQPWLYCHLPDTKKTYTVSWWNHDGSNEFYDALQITAGVYEVWHTLSNWYDVRELGQWNVRLDYSSSAGTGSANTNFIVTTPEPVSSALFLIGGGALAMLTYRRRKAKGMKGTLMVIGFLMISMLFAGSALAIVDTPTLDMVTGNGSTTAQPHSVTPNFYAEYGWTQQPWLRVTLPTDVEHYTVSWWNPVANPGNVYIYTEASSGVNDVWHSLTNWFSTARAYGDWQIKLDYSTGGTNANSTLEHFTITPEPVSSALFLIGGGALAVISYRRRRMNA